MKILRAWIAPFPTQSGKSSGMNSIAMRVSKEEDKFPLTLTRETEFPELIRKGEVHYLLSLIDDDSLLVLKEAIDKYFEEN